MSLASDTNVPLNTSDDKHILIRTRSIYRKSCLLKKFAGRFKFKHPPGGRGGFVGSGAAQQHEFVAP
ncbi:hypothetical protein GCM10020370_01090 [Paenibacillus hodogayensis]